MSLKSELREERIEQEKSHGPLSHWSYSDSYTEDDCGGSLSGHWKDED